MTGPESTAATPRVAAGALFVDGERVLLVHKTYGNGWDIPGGYVEDGESPAVACRRELSEELGIDRAPGRLLVCDWAPSAREGDKLLFVFDGGALGADERRLRPDGDELDRWEWVPVAELRDRVIPRLARRLEQAHRAATDGTVSYLEHGEPPSSTD